MQKENSAHLTTAAQILVVLTPFKGQRETNLHRALSAGLVLALALSCVESQCVGTHYSAEACRSLY